MELFKPKGTIDFMKNRGPLMVVSGLLMVAGLVSIFWPGPNYGIDFKGGTEVQLRFGGAIDPGTVRKTLGDAGYDAEVVSVDGRNDEYLVRVGRVSALRPEEVESIKKKLGWNVSGVHVDELKVSPGGDKITLRMADQVDPETIETSFKGAGANVRAVHPFGASDQHRYEVQLVGVADQMLSALSAKLGAAAPKDPLRVEWVGPKAGKQLRDAAFKSVLWTLLFIMGYIALRFDLRFAPGGIIALIHDTMITILVFVILRREVNLATIAALLTILGYSIDHTIVVFDRIRENMVRMRDASMYDLINVSTTQTLSRTLVTSWVTLLSILPFLYWGTPIIKDFALALSIGMICGAYSSIYVSAVVTDWMDKKLFSKASAGSKPTKASAGGAVTSSR